MRIESFWKKEKVSLQSHWIITPYCWCVQNCIDAFCMYLFLSDYITPWL